MDFSGEYRIPAAPAVVWAALNDPEVLRACIPGCKELTATGDNAFVATVAAKVGPISATFKGNVTLTDIDAPHGYTISGQGQGGAAGFAKGGARVTLAADGGDTVLRYDAKVDIGGKLASVGSRLVQGVAKKNADDFFGAFVAMVGAPAAEPEPAPVVAAAAGAAPAGGLLSNPWLLGGIAVAAGAALLLVTAG